MRFYARSGAPASVLTRQGARSAAGGERAEARPGQAQVKRSVPKVGRNDPCPCGSGKKYKDCHQREGTAFLRKLARQEDKKKTREARRRLKEQGVPWYKRLFVKI